MSNICHDSKMMVLVDQKKTITWNFSNILITSYFLVKVRLILKTMYFFLEKLKPYHTFKNISPSVYQEIKNFIKLKYKIKVLSKTLPGLTESFEILCEFIKVHYYTKGKLLFQSSPTNKTYVKLVFDIDKKFSLNTLDEVEQKTTVIPSDAKIFVGCNESGAGETFGSMFLGCVIVDVKNLKNIEQIFDTQNIKELNESEILEKHDKIKKYCKIFKIKCEASEIDETSKNTLLDQKYEELLGETISGKEKLCVIIDDYGIKRGLKLFLENLSYGMQTISVKGQMVKLNSGYI